MYDPFGFLPIDSNIIEKTKIGSSSRGSYSEQEWNDMYSNLFGIFTNMQNAVQQEVAVYGEMDLFLRLSSILRNEWSKIYNLTVNAVRINQMVDRQVGDLLQELNERFRSLVEQMKKNEPLLSPSAFGPPSAAGAKSDPRDPIFMQVLKAIPKGAPTSSSSSASPSSSAASSSSSAASMLRRSPTSSSSSASPSSSAASSSSSAASMLRRSPMTVADMRRRARLQPAEARRSTEAQSRIDELRRQARERAMLGMPSKRRKEKLRF